MYIFQSQTLMNFVELFCQFTFKSWYIEFFFNLRYILSSFPSPQEWSSSLATESFTVKKACSNSLEDWSRWLSHSVHGLTVFYIPDNSVPFSLGEGLGSHATYYHYSGNSCSKLYHCLFVRQVSLHFVRSAVGLLKNLKYKCLHFILILNIHFTCICLLLDLSYIF